MRDDELLPVFLAALKETGQKHVVRLLQDGLHTLVTLLILYVVDY